MEAQLLARPRIALAMGDAAGVSSELAAKVLADPAVREAAEITVIGDARMLARGAEFAGVNPDVDVVRHGRDRSALAGRGRGAASTRHRAPHRHPG